MKKVPKSKLAGVQRLELQAAYSSVFLPTLCFRCKAAGKTLKVFPQNLKQSDKFLDLGTLTRLPSNIYARVNWSAIRDRCTRIQGHQWNLFRRPWIFGLLSLKHHISPYHASIFWYTQANFSFQRQQRKFSSPYFRNDTMNFHFLNDGNLDKCLSKKEIRLATPALWLSSPHWAKCMPNSYPLRSPSKRHAQTTALTSAPCHVSVPRSRNFSDC